MKRLGYLMVLIMSLLTGLIIQQQTVQAAGAGFTASPVVGEDQLNGVASYFDLLITPGTKRDLQVRVTNSTNTEKKLVVTLTNAYTQSNGEISYQPNNQQDESLKVPLTSLSSKPKQNVTLKAKETQTVTIPMTMPKTAFKGVKLGAVYILDKETYAGESKGSMTLNNRFATSIGVKLQTNKQAMHEVTPRVRLRAIKPGIDRGKAAVFATLQNDQPVYFTGMHIDAKITQRGKSEVLMKQSVAKYAMAPNSNFDYAIHSDKALAPGEYTLYLTATTQKHSWTFKRNFAILAAEAEKINKAAGLKLEPQRNWLLIGAIAGVIVLLILVLILWWRKRRRAVKS